MAGIPSYITLPVQAPPGVIPTESYLTYMNDRARIRKTLKDLFMACRQEHVEATIRKRLTTDAHPTILVINSYSADNVDAISAWLRTLGIQKRALVLFTNFDERAIQMHKDRIMSLGTTESMHVVFDDIRSTRIRPRSTDLVINDFRLNFNTAHVQDHTAVTNMVNILKPHGAALISVVVDGRYESARFGRNQEKAPVNIHKPWVFNATEGLARYSHTIPYYIRLFEHASLHIQKEFDIKEGKQWANQFENIKSETKPFFRRFFLTK